MELLLWVLSLALVTLWAAIACRAYREHKHRVETERQIHRAMTDAWIRKHGNEHQPDEGE